jgi:tagaturonate epimerase
VDRFIDASDFYTLDVAAAIGQAAEEERVEAFLAHHAELLGTLSIPGINQPFTIDREAIARTARKYLAAVQQAGAIYRHVDQKRGGREFITEVSMDETDTPQTPPELLVILAALADERIPVQTIAPKFTGRFNKGVDYVGDVVQFEKEFSEDLAVIAFAVRQYGLPANLKLSIHSGSDKFSIYTPVRRALRRFGAGVHLKTAGTTWLEELIGLAEAGGKGLDLAKQVYAKAFENRDALCEPYASVIDIDYAKLPEPAAVNGWSSEQFTSALRHDQKNPGFNPDLRQLLHVGFKVAAKMGDKYLKMLETCEPSISRNVTENLFERHIKPLFLAS